MMSVILVFVAGGLAGCVKREEPRISFGTYWWQAVTNDSLTNDLAMLEFATKRGVNEIYLHQGGRLQEVNPNGVWGPNGKAGVVNPTRQFIAAATQRGIRVYQLFSSGGNILLEDNSARTRFDLAMIGLQSYQELVGENERFAGIQFNIEPHQMPDWTANRNLWGQRKIDFVQHVHDTYGNYFQIDWCIPAWWHNPEFDLVTHRGVAGVPLYRAIMREGNRTQVMAFRQTAENMVNFGRNVLTFGREIGQEVIVIATVFASDGPNFEFHALGEDAMLRELGRIEEIANSEIGNMKTGTAVHHIATWYNWAR